MEGFGNSGSWFFRWSVLQLRLLRCLWTAKIIGCIISSASCCALACEHPHFARHSVCSVALGLVVTSAAQISLLLFHRVFRVHHLVLLRDLMNFQISFLSRVCWCEVMPPEFRDSQLASSAKSGQHGENRFRLARLTDQSLDITCICNYNRCIPHLRHAWSLPPEPWKSETHLEKCNLHFCWWFPPEK